MERVRYFEDYEVGEARETLGRTITETDMVIHAGHSGISFPIIWMRNSARHSHSDSASPMAR